MAATYGLVYGVDVQIESAQFHELIPNSSERQQLINHAAVIGIPTVFYVEAQVWSIIRVVCVCIPPHIQNLQCEVHSAAFHHAVGGLVSGRVEELQDNETTARCPDSHTFRQSLSLFKAGKQLIALHNRPIPDSSSIRPEMIAIWNTKKGPVDSTSQELGTLHRGSVKDSPPLFASLERSLLLSTSYSSNI